MASSDDGLEQALFGDFFDDEFPSPCGYPRDSEGEESFESSTQALELQAASATETRVKSREEDFGSFPEITRSSAKRKFEKLNYDGSEVTKLKAELKRAKQADRELACDVCSDARKCMAVFLVITWQPVQFAPPEQTTCVQSAVRRLKATSRCT